MYQAADVQLRPASPRRLLGPVAALFVAAAVVAVLLLATAGSESVPNRSAQGGAPGESTRPVQAGGVARGAGHYWLSRGGSSPYLRGRGQEARSR
jgi:hypothetical protein